MNEASTLITYTQWTIWTQNMELPTLIHVGYHVVQECTHLLVSKHAPTWDIMRWR